MLWESGCLQRFYDENSICLGYTWKISNPTRIGDPLSPLHPYMHTATRDHTVLVALKMNTGEVQVQRRHFSRGPCLNQAGPSLADLSNSFLYL